MKSIYIILFPIVLCLWSCSEKHNNELAYNNKASLPESFNFNSMGLKVITSSVNSKKHTMSTCYGNDIAVASARAGKQPNYPDGALLTLITWQQQEDPNWFGGNIPANIESVETIKLSAPANLPASGKYQKFTGKNLQEVAANQIKDESSRINYILGLRAAVMP